MSVPALRQPKLKTAVPEKGKKTDLPQPQYVILTLRDEKKLVVSSDAYHGILSVENTYKCVFCSTAMQLDSNIKEFHKIMPKHKIAMDTYPFIEDFAENLIKQLKTSDFYCTICNVIVSSSFMPNHVVTEVHTQELEKAIARSFVYKPF